MASPQAEEGHTRIANELMEALSKQQLTGHEWRVLIVLLRQTYGWSRKAVTVGLSGLQTATGLHQRAVCEALRRLKDRNIIMVIRDNGHRNTYQIQKDYDNWTSAENRRCEKQQMCENPQMTSAENRRSQVCGKPQISKNNKASSKTKAAQAPSTQKQSADIPPAIAVYRGQTKRYPAKDWWQQVDETVGRTTEALQFWATVIHEYRGTFPNGYHVKAMLEYFQRREIPGQRPAQKAGSNGTGQRRVETRASTASLEDINAIRRERGLPDLTPEQYANSE